MIVGISRGTYASETGAAVAGRFLKKSPAKQLRCVSAFQRRSTVFDLGPVDYLANGYVKNFQRNQFQAEVFDF